MDQLEQMFNDRVSDAWWTLTSLTETAAQAKETGKAAAEYAQAIGRALELFGLIETEQVTADDTTTVARLIAVEGALKAESGQDRTEGDALAAQMRGMLQAGITLADGVSEAVDQAVTAWQATAPKGKGKGSGSGSRATAGQGSGVNVELKCSCGWINHDSTSTNSARWLYLCHLEKNAQSHPTVTRKPAKGESDWQAITDIVRPVASGTEGQASGSLADGTKLTVTVA